jgi:GR25 family glycosyltransferase involved in LPS biosynthesis
MDLVVTESTKKKEKTTMCLNMIVKNEANVIVSTLNNLTSCISFDYWVISDTGSTDNTQQIITDYFLEKGIPGELVSHEWKNFGYNRSKALECAYDKSDYLLIFDADDTMMGDFKLPFTCNTNNTNTYVDRYMLKIGKGFEYVRPLLINNRKRWEFKGVLHEFLSNIDVVNTPDITIQGNYYIESGRSGNRSQNPTKYYDDAIILQNAYETELALPDKGLSGRYAFYCARSYKDAGEKYHDKAIEWYKKVLDRQHHWHQEKYYSALEIGIIYKDKKQMDLAVQYLLKTLEYDIERIEGLIMAVEYFYHSGQYILVNALYHKFKNYNKNLQNKLFINMHYYEYRLEFLNGISAHFVNDKESGYKCCKQIIIDKKMGLHELIVTINNILCYKDILETDKDILPLFRALDNLIHINNEMVNNSSTIDLWNILFKQLRPQLTILNKGVIKNIQRTQQLNNTNNTNNKPKIIITFTTCKRLDLFKETLNSILNHWTDIDLITDWFCVDDNSSNEERHFMKSTYHWIDYYMKTTEEKGHRCSMNIIWNKLQSLKPAYWIHMEDDFLFYHQTNYITQSISLLSKNNHNIKQVVFNRNYGETVSNYNVKGHLPMTNAPIIQGIVLHDHRPNENINHYPNSHYWPHYSFRPSMTLVKSILNLGNFDSPNQFFERDYADRWNEAGYKTAFFDRITHRHIGRLTSEIKTGTVKNAYELNNEAQFQGYTSNLKIVNLERRADRKAEVSNLFKEAKQNNFIFYKAVDGKQLESTNELKHLFRGNDFGNRRGVIGCALSHYKLWQDLIEDKTHNYYVIFEDDIHFNNQASKFKERFDKLKPAFEKNEVLFLGYHMFTRRRNEVKHIYDTIEDNTIIKVEPLNKDIYIGGTFSYSINKEGATKLLAYIHKNGIKHGIDYLMKIAEGLDIKEIQPFLVFSDWYEDTTKPIDTDIQSNYDSLDFNQTVEDQFEFIPHLDQISNDIYFHKGTAAECMSKALKDTMCAGFNTLGFFKNKIEMDKLTSSGYFRENDGIYIKKSVMKEAKEAKEAKETKPIRLKILCNWCTSEQLCKEWSNMYMQDNKWKQIVMTSSNDPHEIDYYVIINSPQPTDQYVPERTIVFQMEPWVADPEKNWGVKTWGEWATPDPNKFFKVFTHKTHLNNVQWQIDYPFYTEPINNKERKNKMIAICSQKNFDKGHILRNNFIKYVEDSSTSLIDSCGRENYHHFKNYVGKVPSDNKYNVYSIYKYCLAAENNSEHNYATEKLWEAILCESLCFYWGCPNLEEYIDEKAFVRLPLEDPVAALKIIQQAIDEDWWSQRIEVIKQMKERILNKLGFFPLLESILY